MTYHMFLLIRGPNVSNIDKEAIYKNMSNIEFTCSIRRGKQGSLMSYHTSIFKKQKVCLLRLVTDAIHIDNLKVECDNMLEYADGVVKFNIPKDINGRSVISVDTFIHKAFILLVKQLHESGVRADNLTIDLTQSDLSNIVDASGMLSYLTGCRVLMPVGDRQLQPVNLSYALKCSDISNIDEVISKIDFSRVVNISGMFYASPIEYIDFCGSDLNRVKDASSMFCLCKNLKHVEFGDKAFTHLESTSSMFEESLSLTEFNMGCITRSTLEDADRMFSECSKLESIRTPRGWSDCFTSCDMYIHTSYMFNHCTELFNIDFVGFIEIFRSVSLVASTFYMCKRISMRDISITTRYMQDIVRIMFGTMSSAVDVRGTRVNVIKSEDCSLNDIDEYYSDRNFGSVVDGRILVIDSGQYYKYADAIDEYVIKYNCNLIKCDSEELDITLMKSSLFGCTSCKKGLECILVDESYENIS